MAKAGRDDAPPAVHGYDFTLKTEDGRLVVVTKEGVQEIDFVNTGGQTLGANILRNDPVVIGSDSAVVDDTELNVAIGSTAQVEAGDFGSTHNIAMGADALTSSFSAIAIGSSARAEVFRSIAIGREAQVTTAPFTGHGIAIGYQAHVQDPSEHGLAIGDGAVVNGDHQIGLGRNVAVESGIGAIAIGRNAIAGDARSVAIGEGATIEGTGLGTHDNAVALGPFSEAEESSTAVGRGASALRNIPAEGSVAVGAAASAEDDFALALGKAAIASARNSVGINADVAIEGAGRVGVDQLAFGNVLDTIGDSDLQNEEMVAELVPGDSAYRMRGKDGSGNVVQDQSRSAVNSVSSNGSTEGSGLPQTELVDTTGGAVTRTLATADVEATGTEITVKDSVGNAGTEPITVDTEGAAAIDGNTSITIDTNREAVVLISDGTNWHIKSRYAGGAV